MILGNIHNYYLPETNIAPENRPKPKRKRSYSNHPFSGAMLVFGGQQNYSKLSAASTNKPLITIHQVCGNLSQKSWASASGLK